MAIKNLIKISDDKLCEEWILKATEEINEVLLIFLKKKIIL